MLDLYEMMSGVDIDVSDAQVRERCEAAAGEAEKMLASSPYLMRGGANVQLGLRKRDSTNYHHLPDESDLLLSKSMQQDLLLLTNNNNPNT